MVCVTYAFVFMCWIDSNILPVIYFRKWSNKNVFYDNVLCRDLLWRLMIKEKYLEIHNVFIFNIHKLYCYKHSATTENLIALSVRFTIFHKLYYHQNGTNHRSNIFFIQMFNFQDIKKKTIRIWIWEDDMRHIYIWFIIKPILGFYPHFLKLLH